MTSTNKNPTKFYCKEEIGQSYDNKMYPELVLNKLKVMKNSTSIYIYQAPSSRKFFKLPIYTWLICSPICAHVWTMSELKLN